MDTLNLIIGVIAISLLLFICLLLVCTSTLLKWLICVPIALMGALAKLDLYLGGIMQNIANLLNLLNLQDHDQN